MTRWNRLASSWLIGLTLVACTTREPVRSDTTTSVADAAVDTIEVHPDVHPVDGGADSRGDAEADLTDPCAAFDELITREALEGHLVQFDQIAQANGNTRAVGTPGFDLSASYLQGQLVAVGLAVSTPGFMYHDFRFLGPGALEITSPTIHAFNASSDFYQPQLDSDAEYTTCWASPPSDVTAELAAVDLQLGLGNTSTSGCEAEDFVGGKHGSVVANRIALIQRGSCTFREKVLNAQVAGAVGVVLFNQGNTWSRRGLMVPDLFGGELSHGIKIPVVFTTTAAAETLVAISARAVVTMHMVTDTKLEIGQSSNVVTEIAGSLPDEIIMLGAHLDSVLAGPGINDNASGSSALLEIARHLQACPPRRTVRLAWWSKEEGGLWGSSSYVAELGAVDMSRLLGYINLDMIGSSNHIYQLGDGDGSVSGQPGPGTSAELEAFFHQDFAATGESLLEAPFHMNSDYAQFYVAGIGVADLTAGVNGIKTAEEAALFGGTVGQQHDPCFHKLCDDLSNVDLDVLETIARSAARAVQHFGIEGKGLNPP